jgi:hypothetical protein
MRGVTGQRPLNVSAIGYEIRLHLRSAQDGNGLLYITLSLTSLKLESKKARLF